MARAKDGKSGQRPTQRSKYGRAVATCVCWHMSSETTVR